MTLIISEISKYGIVMVADSAVTITSHVEGDRVSRVQNDALKLQQIPYLGAGISMWGLGEIPKSKISTDKWISEFIESHDNLSSLQGFADSLATELQNVVGNIAKPMGFHLAGYVEIDGTKLPSLYHIRNVDGTYERYSFHDFVAGHDFPPSMGDVLEESDFWIRNGDYGKYALLVTAVNQFLPIIQIKTGLELPPTTIHGRLMYHAAWIRFVSNLYESADKLKTIGGKISAMGILPSGKIVQRDFD